MSRSQRDKGARGEREVVELLRAVYPGAHRRAMQARGGVEGPDVEGTPWWVEVKRRAKPTQTCRWLRQAQLDATEHHLRSGAPRRTAILFERCDNDDWIVTLPVELALQIMKGRDTNERKTDGISEIIEIGAAPDSA